jgi:hypothetical protein
MKPKSLIITLAVGLLAAGPAYAFGSFNSATYASRFRPAQPAPSASAKVRPTASQEKSEIQVAIMVTSPSQATGDIWFGTSPRTHATHSH